MDLNSSDSDSDPEDTGKLALVPRTTPCAASAPPRPAASSTALPPGWKRCNSSSNVYFNIEMDINTNILTCSDAQRTISLCSHSDSHENRHI